MWTYPLEIPFLKAFATSSFKCFAWGKHTAANLISLISWKHLYWREGEKSYVFHQKEINVFSISWQIFLKVWFRKKKHNRKKDFKRSVSNRDFLHYLLNLWHFFRLIKDSLCFQHEENPSLKTPFSTALPKAQSNFMRYFERLYLKIYFS